MRPDPIQVLLELSERPARAGRLRHVERLPDRVATTVDWPGWADEAVVAAWRAHGVTRPWRHQAQAADLAWSGRHVVISTGTASGKSLGYLLPALSALVGPPAAVGGRARAPSVLYLSPTKALARDQLRAVCEVARDLTAVRAAAVDGDNDREERTWARGHANLVFANPDVCHHTLLPDHARWARLWSGLRYVIVDECHHYRGVFGSHVAQVLRRLRRICAHYGADPTFVLASATVSEPDVTASRLTGLPVSAVTEDASPRAGSYIAFWEPALTDGGGENGAPLRRSAPAETAELVSDLVTAGVRTLAFVRSRRAAETVALGARRLLAEVDPELRDRVAPYRGGYLSEDRRAIEAELASGSLLALAATNALELGIDVAGLDAVVTTGYPGTRAAFWQQIGRAGRDRSAALGVLVARDDPLDTYLVNHPEALLHAAVEATVVDPDNPYVLGPHLCAAAAELPLEEPDLALFGPQARAGVDALVTAGMLRRRPRGWYWTRRQRAGDLADIRSAGGRAVSVVQSETGRLIGTVDAGAAHRTVHDGAVYLHRGETYLVDQYDEAGAVAEVSRVDPGYTTTARDITDIRIRSTEVTSAWGQATLSFGSVQVTNQVVAYLKRRAGTGEVLGEEPLDLPERTLATKAVWWTLPDEAVRASGLAPAEVAGAAHAAEHAAIGLLPLFATCDRWDIGGVSTASHPDTGRLSVFVYDGNPGGAGFAERAFRTAVHWLSTTRDAIESCECDDGCPSCVQSPKCGNQNSPLDKSGAVVLLTTLLDSAPPPHPDTAELVSQPEATAGEAGPARARLRSVQVAPQ